MLLIDGKNRRSCPWILYLHHLSKTWCMSFLTIFTFWVNVTYLFNIFNFQRKYQHVEMQCYFEYVTFTMKSISFQNKVSPHHFSWYIAGRLLSDSTGRSSQPVCLAICNHFHSSVIWIQTWALCPPGSRTHINENWPHAGIISVYCIS